MADELFTPTIKASPVPAKPPWRPDSILYPAFFGGPLAGTVLGLLNGRRLSLGWRHLLLVALAGVTCIAGRMVFTAAAEGNNYVRIAGGAAGILVWLAVAWLQRRPFRAFTSRDGEPASLVVPGLAAAIGCGFVESAIIFGVIL